MMQQREAFQFHDVSDQLKQDTSLLKQNNRMKPTEERNYEIRETRENRRRKSPISKIKRVDPFRDFRVFRSLKLWAEKSYAMYACLMATGLGFTMFSPIDSDEEPFFQMGPTMRTFRIFFGVVCCMVWSGLAQTPETPETPETADTNGVDQVVRAVSDTDAAYDDIAVLTESLLLVRRYYVEPKPFRDVVYGAVNGMLGALDPNSAFLAPDALRRFDEETAGEFSGIGLSATVEGRQIRVIAPIEDSPAFKAGIRAGDRISMVDGERFFCANTDEAARRLRGPRGSTVRLVVEREGDDPREVVLARDEVRVASVKGTSLLPNGIGYLRVTAFNVSTAEAFRNEVASLKVRSMRALVVDLRDNPGGLLEAAVEMLGCLLPDGTLAVTVTGRGNEVREKHDTSGKPLTDVPVAVLVNAGSASAAEIFAGALQAHRRAIVVGQRTYGKASVQNLLRLALRKDCGVKLTTGYYTTPDGRMIHGRGIDPDLPVPMAVSVWREIQTRRIAAEQDKTPFALPPAEDEPFARALDALAGALILSPVGR